MFAMPPFHTPLGRLRLVGFVEGISYLVLLGVAMPLKYLAGMPQAVRIVGSIHGALFVLFVAAVVEVAVKRNWWTADFWGKAVLASLVPFGTFVFDRRLKEAEESDAAVPATSEAR